jgi:hypothetical protein
MKKKLTLLAVVFLVVVLVTGCGPNKEDPLPGEGQKNEAESISGDMALEVVDNAVVVKVNSNVPDGGVFELVVNYKSDTGTTVESGSATMEGGKIIKEFAIPNFTGYISGLAVLDFEADVQPQQIKELGANRENLNISSDEIPYPNKDAVKKKAFANWEKQYSQQSKMLDESLVAWKSIMQGLASGSIGEHDAYDKLQSLDKRLSSIFSKDFTNDTWAITELSKEQCDSLKDAFNDMFTAVHFRQQAVKAALKWIDDPAHSSAQKIKDNAELADSCVLDGVAKVTKIKQELGLIE